MVIYSKKYLKKIFIVLMLILLYGCAHAESTSVQWKDIELKNKVYVAVNEDNKIELTSNDLKKYTELFMLADKYFYFGAPPTKMVDGKTLFKGEIISHEQAVPQTISVLPDGRIKIEDEICEVNNSLGLNDLANFTNLRSIVIYGVTMENIDFIKEMPNLKKISIIGCELEDITALSKCDKLEYVSLSHNKIKDISVFGDIDLQKIAQIDLSYNQISNISPLTGKEYQKERTLSGNLPVINLNNNYIADISSIKGLNQIGILYLENNCISDSSPLDTLEEENLVFLNGNPCSLN